MPTEDQAKAAFLAYVEAYWAGAFKADWDRLTPDMKAAWRAVVNAVLEKPCGH